MTDASRFADACARTRFLLLGMVHLAPLPGAPRWAGSMAEVLDAAVADATTLAAAGFDGVVVENYGDAPFLPAALPPETVAALAVAVHEVRRALPAAVLVGVNALRNDAAAALAVAVATGADLIRVNVHTGAMWTDQGLLQGEAWRTLRERSRLGAEVAIAADVLVKHGAPPVAVAPEHAARDNVDRGLADVLVVTGAATGEALDVDRLRAVAAGAGDRPVLAGSGVTTEGLRALAAAGARGAIVGTAIKVDGRTTAPVDPLRAAALASAVRRLP